MSDPRHAKQIVVPRDLRRLATLREEVKTFLGARAMPRRAAWRTVLAVDEAVSNIIIHNDSDPALPPIEIDMRAADDKVEVNIRDAGKKFDPCAKSLVEVGGRPRGMGLYLIRKAVDEVRYRFLCGRYNELTLIKYAR